MHIQYIHLSSKILLFKVSSPKACVNHRIRPLMLVFIPAAAALAAAVAHA